MKTMKIPIDAARLKEGVKQCFVSGDLLSGNLKMRRSLVEEAIKYYQEHAEPREEYWGIKNYAGFGDQRSDHSRYMGPRDGNIVFYVHNVKGRAVDSDGVYYLLVQLENPGVDIRGELTKLAKAEQEIERIKSIELQDFVNN